jgi:biopolymer transport protein TolQ
MLKKFSQNKENLFKMLNRTDGEIFSSYQKGAIFPESPFQKVYEEVASELNRLLDANIKRNIPKKLTNTQLNVIMETADSAISNQVMLIEKFLLVLATTASISPLLGLLGTVWGLLLSFQGMAAYGTVILSVIAPGIAEALVTTVAGLIVAIPAQIGYNWITERTQTMTRELEDFASRILSYIQITYCAPSSYEKEQIF